MRKIYKKYPDTRCRYCHIGTDLTIDHIIPKSRGGKSHHHNYQVLCKYCNTNKGAWTDTEVAAIFRDIKEYGVRYDWEKRVKRWLDYIEYTREEQLNWYPVDKCPK